jgi:cytoskeleton protein RodZ
MTDIGAMLRDARMREHLDIAEFEARTKIRAKYLRALEDEEWSLLPGYPFAKAFLRTYADMLGLDGRMLVDEFKRQYRDPSDIDLAPVAGRRDGRRARERPRERAAERGRVAERGREHHRRRGPSSRLLLVAVLVVLLAAALFAVQQLRNGHGSPANHTTTSHTQTTTTTTHHAPAVTRVALRLVPTTSVRVCLIGYRTPGNRGHQRLSALLAPGYASPTFHAYDRFAVSFTGGMARMIIDGHRVAVTATGTTVSYEILLSGRRLTLPAGTAPRCS